MTTKEKQYTHIWINSEGVLFAVAMPEKVDYIDFKNVDDEGRERYEQIVALSKQEPQAVRFRDHEYEVVCLLSGETEAFKCIDWRFDHKNTLHTLPREYQIGVKRIYGEDSTEKDIVGECYAILEKLSPESAAPVSGKEEELPKELFNAHRLTPEGKQRLKELIKKQRKNKNGAILYTYNERMLLSEIETLEQELSRLRSLVKAAEEVIKIYTESNPPKGYTKELIALENYQQLKTKL